MKLYLAASEHQCMHEYLLKTKIEPLYHLFSYFYISKNQTNYKNYSIFSAKSKNILIDSGAHTFHTAKNVDFLEYTKRYSEFIKENDSSNVVGYFEMDIDNRIGYKKVMKLRKMLEEVNDKIIPVWHKNRGFKNFKKMCRNYDYVAISCLKIEGIPDQDLFKFVDVAHDNGCLIHGLGGTRKFILNNVPFDSVDSASWLFSAVNGRYKSKHIDRNSLTYCEKLVLSLLDWRKKQRYYEKYWREKNKRLKNGKI